MSSKKHPIYSIPLYGVSRTKYTPIYGIPLYGLYTPIQNLKKGVYKTSQIGGPEAAPAGGVIFIHPVFPPLDNSNVKISVLCVLST